MSIISTKQFRLLPNYVKKICFIIFLVAIVFPLCASYPIITWPENIGILKKISFDFALISLFLMTMSKNKIEDELTHLIRLRSYASAFFMGVVMVIFSSITNLFHSFTIDYQIKGEEVVFYMLGFYFIFYYLERKQSK